MSHKMQERTFLSTTGEAVKIQLEPPANIPSFFVFALHKSGSTMLDKILEEICSFHEIPLLSVSKSAFNQGVPEHSLSDDIRQLFVATGYGFYGFRYIPSYLKGFYFSRFKKIWLIRDPRDIVVSHYFSMKKSHAIPPGSQGKNLLELREKLSKIDIDDYVIQAAPKFKNIFNSYKILDDDRLKLFRYEDIIFNKSQWIKEMVDFLELNLEDSKINEIAARHDVFPDDEDVSLHVRQVSPGDHQRKLKQKTIEQLNDIFKEILEKYEYPITGSTSRVAS